MRINEESINHNTVRLISEVVSFVYDTLGPEDDRIRIEILGEVHGIIMMAEAMKEVLKA